MKIQDVMCPEVVACHPWDTIDEAAKRMWEADIGCLPVVDHEACLVGMVTDRDLLMSAWLQGDRLGRLHVDGAMARNVHACRADDPVERALELMSTHRVRRLPVVDERDRPVGVISLNDLARRSDDKGQPRQKDLLHVLAEVCTPRVRELSCVAREGLVAGTR